jgi:protein-tyrosine phosphatase
MDENNLRNLKRWLRIPNDEWNEARAGSVPKVSLLLEHAPEEYTSGRSRLDGLEVADPWYTGNFDATWEDVCAGCRGLLEELK